MRIKSSGLPSFDFMDNVCFDPVSLGIAGVSSLAGSLINANAAGNAAKTQQNAANSAAQAQMQMYQQIADRMAPYINFGNTSAQQLQSALPGLRQAGTNALPTYSMFNPSDLQNTPGYQFTLNQGLQGVQNGYAAQGLGTSGAAMKGAANYTTGLADATYNQQLQNYMAQQGQQFSQGLAGNNQQMQQAMNQYAMLFGPTQLGANTANSLGNQGIQSQNIANNFLTSGAAAKAAGEIGQANAFSGALGNIGNLAMLSNLGGMFGGGGGGSTTNPLFNMSYPSNYMAFGGP